MMSWQQHIASPADLVTTRAQTARGFEKLATVRQEVASPYAKKIEKFRRSLEKVSSTEDLLRLMEYNESLKANMFAAVGLSAKSMAHMDSSQQEEILRKYFRNALIIGAEGVEMGEIRRMLTEAFAMTIGESLGGRMRNVGGAIGKETFESVLIEAINATPGVELVMKGRANARRLTSSSTYLQWQGSRGVRSLWLDKIVPAIKKNVDFVLIEGISPSGRMPTDTNRYIAIGELKAGIDPAGADEHWKTANHAFARVRQEFGADNSHPKFFFVGASITRAMAAEIYQQLCDGKLHHAANLLNREQLSGLCKWLVSL